MKTNPIHFCSIKHSPVTDFLLPSTLLIPAARYWQFSRTQLGLARFATILTKAFFVDYIGLLINSFRRRIPWRVLRHCGMNLRNGKDRHASIIWISTSRKGEERNGEQGKSEGFEQLLSDRSSLKSFHRGFIRQDSLACEISPSHGFLR